MDNHIFRQVSDQTVEKVNPYSKFGLLRNPFPTKPSVVVNSSDSRENGSIFLPELREAEQEVFERMLIPAKSRPQTHTIAFLMDYATRHGRGIGKTSFLFYQLHRIMEDLGNEMSNGTQVLFASYVLPSDSSQRKFWRFCQALIESVATETNPIICMAMWRMRVFSGIIPQSVLEKTGDVPAETIGNNNWLQKQGIDVLFELSPAIEKKLHELGVTSELVDALIAYGHSVRDFQRFYLEKQTETFWRKRSATIFFDDFVKLFNAAGFTKSLILIDEVEKIVQPQNTTERRAFTNSLRYYLMDGQCENTRLSFYSFLLTIHPYIQEILTPHWEASGLNRFSALSRELAPEYTVYLELLNQNLAVPLAQAYIDKSRSDESDKGDLKPFTTEALTEALIQTRQVPGRFLMLLNNAVEMAIRQNWAEIGVEEIKQIVRNRVPTEPAEPTPLEPLPLPVVQLSEG